MYLKYVLELDLSNNRTINTLWSTKGEVKADSLKTKLISLFIFLRWL